MNHDLVAIVPIRSLTGGKTRLASVLSPVEREALIKSMLRQVVDAAIGSGAVSRLSVISTDPSALAFAQTLDSRVATLLQDAGAPGLVPALNQARAAELAGGASALLMLFGDLPLLEAIDIRKLVQNSAPVVIAPDQRGAGTNALLLRGERRADFSFQFGPDSHQRHISEATRLGLATSTSHSPGTSFDLDTPEDWRLLGISRSSILRGGPARALLQEATPR